MPFHTKFQKILGLAANYKKSEDKEVEIKWNKGIKRHLEASYDDLHPPDLEKLSSVLEENKQKQVSYW